MLRRSVARRISSSNAAIAFPRRTIVRVVRLAPSALSRSSCFAMALRRSFCDAVRWATTSSSWAYARVRLCCGWTSAADCRGLSEPIDPVFTVTIPITGRGSLTLTRQHFFDSPGDRLPVIDSLSANKPSAINRSPAPRRSAPQLNATIFR